MVKIAYISVRSKADERASLI